LPSGQAEGGGQLGGLGGFEGDVHGVALLVGYSISNSASAEPQSKHQYTGLRPR
jgi:hypothetical protein